LQAATGIMKRYGGEQKPEVHGIASAVDYLTGYSGGLGVALSLLKQKRSGSAEGILTGTSLVQSAQLIQLPFLYLSEKCESGNEPKGQDALGENSLYRAYNAKDGWIFIASGCEKGGSLNLAKIKLFKSIPLDSGKERELFLEKKIKTKKMSYWVKEINNVNVGCHSVDNFNEIRNILFKTH